MNQAMQKAKEMSDIAKLNSMISEEETKINNTYYQIGKLYVAMHSHDYEEEFAGMITTIADKIVGRAAAFLYVKLGAAGVYAPVMSRGAKELLAEYNIPAEADELTENIRNRQNTGLCPMECAVSSCGSPEAAYVAILEAIRKMQQK